MSNFLISFKETENIEEFPMKNESENYDFEIAKEKTVNEYDKEIINKIINGKNETLKELFNENGFDNNQLVELIDSHIKQLEKENSNYD